MNIMAKKLAGIIVVLAIIMIIGSSVFFIINEGEQAVVTRFGRVLPNNYDQAGLKFKMPFIDVVHKYPKKLLSWDGQADLLPTSDDNRVLLDTTARWRIADPKNFYSKLTDINDAFNKLDDIIDKRVRAVIGRYPMVEIVRANNEMIAITAKKEELSEEELLAAEVAKIADAPNTTAVGSPEITLINESNAAGVIVEINQGRLALEQEILEFSRQEINPESLGIELVDVLIRQVQYPDNVAAKAYQRMASERKKRAAEQRSRGEGQKAYWLGRLRKEKQTIIASAESKAAAIYRNAYNIDPEFYQFWRAMDSYEATLAGTVKILSTDMAYFNYLYSPSGEQ